MINVPDSIKQLLKRDSVKKNMSISFPYGGHEPITNENIAQDSAKFTESLCSRDSVQFGLCERASFEFDAYNIYDIKDLIIDVQLEVDATGTSYNNPEVYVFDKEKSPDFYNNAYETKLDKEFNIGQTVNITWTEQETLDSGYGEFNFLYYNGFYKYFYDPYRDQLFRINMINNSAVDYNIYVDIRESGYFSRVRVNNQDDLYDSSIYTVQYLHPPYNNNFRKDNQVIYKYRKLDFFKNEEYYDNGQIVIVYDHPTSQMAYVYKKTTYIKSYDEIRHILLEYGIDLDDDEHKILLDHWTYSMKTDALRDSYYGILLEAPDYYAGHYNGQRLFIVNAHVYKNASATDQSDNWSIDLGFKCLGHLSTNEDESGDELAIKYHRIKIYYRDIVLERINNVQNNLITRSAIFDGVYTMSDSLRYFKVSSDISDISSYSSIYDAFRSIIYVDNSFFNYVDKTGDVITGNIFANGVYESPRNTYIYDTSKKMLVKFEISCHPRNYVDGSDTRYLSYTVSRSYTFIGYNSKNDKNYQLIQSILQKNLKITNIYPEGTIENPTDMDHPIYPIPYGRFLVDECSVADALNKRHVVAYTPSLHAEEMIPSEKSKIDWGVSMKNGYEPNMYALAFVHSNLDPADYAADENSIKTLSKSNDSYYTNLTKIESNGAVRTVTKKINYIWGDMKTEKYRTGIIYKEQERVMPWIGSYGSPGAYNTGNPHYLYLYSFGFYVTIYGEKYTGNLSNNKDIVYKIRTDRNTLSNQLFEMIDDEENDYKIGEYSNIPYDSNMGDMIGEYLGHLIGSNETNLSESEKKQRNRIRKVVFTRMLKLLLGGMAHNEEMPLITRNGCNPVMEFDFQNRSTYKDSAAHKHKKYQIPWLSTSFFSNNKINRKSEEVSNNNANTKNATIYVPTAVAVELASITYADIGYYVHDHTIGNWEMDTYKMYTVRPSKINGKYRQIFYRKLDDEPFVDEIKVSGGLITTKLFELPEPDEDTGAVEINYDLDVNNLVNSTLELSGAFGHWDRQSGTYKMIHIDVDRLKNTIIPNDKLYPYASNLPGVAHHHIRREEYESCTVNEHETDTINAVKYKERTKETNDETHKDEILEEEKIMKDSAVLIDGEHTTENAYDITGNEYFKDLLVKTVSGGGIENPAANLAKEVLRRIKGFGYMPASINMLGRPYLEAGDIVSFESYEYSRNRKRYISNMIPSGLIDSKSPDGEIDDNIEENDDYEPVGYVTIAMRRTLSGIQHLRDSIESK